MATGGMALLLSSQPHTFHGLITFGTIIYIFRHHAIHPNHQPDYLPLFYLPRHIHRFAHTSQRVDLLRHFLALHQQHHLLHGQIRRPLHRALARRNVPRAVLGLFRIDLRKRDIPLLSSLHEPESEDPRRDASVGSADFSVHAVWHHCERWRPVPEELGAKMTMLVAGLTAQGLGMMVSVLMFTIYIRRMIQFGLPSPCSRPAMFIAAGPPSFTSLAIIGLARAYPEEGTYFGDVQITRQVVLILATFTSVFIWSLALWFFCISLVANLAAWREIKFKLNWW